jgi:hypothetical protein
MFIELTANLAENKNNIEAKYLALEQILKLIVSAENVSRTLQQLGWGRGGGVQNLVARFHVT